MFRVPIGVRAPEVLWLVLPGKRTYCGAMPSQGVAVGQSLGSLRLMVPGFWEGKQWGTGAPRNASFLCVPGGAIGPRQSRGFRSSTVCMGLRTGIVGLPNVGKSTLFNAMVEGGKAEAANFPFCTIEPNVGVVSVPDARLQTLGTLSKSANVVPTTVEFVDIAGLVKGASKGEGLGNKFLGHIREVDAIVHVVRCFSDENVVHVDGKVDPASDTEVISFELIFSDIAQVERRLERLQKSKNKSGVEAAQAALEESTLLKVQKALENGDPARSADLSADEQDAIKHLCLLTMKPVIFAANVNESDLANEGANNVHVQELKRLAAKEDAGVVVVSAQVEAELNELGREEAVEFLTSLGAKESGLDSLVRAVYNILGVRTYFTSGEKETRAWTITSGMTAPQAAGVIHTDFEKGFIRAETVSYDSFTTHGGFNGAREKGDVRLEGKEYIVQEGDVMLFRFNV
ncbi:unnamed protein product [Ostreobium quekettii]|uniref:Obg-like ATPase 1 n=1 Tax=Ostreobium quekettii TaxID=121088 RepID=A0A8S1IM92_9CHLO|nr:unnamed protein product [Ostreobium quekettii]